MRPTRLLLDAGGVLIADSGVGVLLRAIAHKMTSGSAQNFEATHQDVFDVWNSRVRERFWSGHVSLDDAKHELCAHFGFSGSDFDWVRAERELPWAKRALSLCTDTAILSNHRSEWLLPALKRFKLSASRVFVSDMLGSCKPSVACFARCLELWGVSDASTVLFADDKLENVSAARSLGMHAIIADDCGEWVSLAKSALKL